MTELRHTTSLAIGGLIALAAALGIGRFVYTPILPLMVEALDLTRAQAGLVASANFAGYLAGALLATTTLITGSRRTWLLSGLAVSALTTGAMASFSSMTVFVLLRFIGGAASAFVLVFSLALVLDRLSLVSRANLSAVHFGGVGVGITASALLVSGLVKLGADWRSLWVASGMLSLIALAIVAYLVPDRTDSPAPSVSASADGNRVFVVLVVAYGLFGFGYVITATFLVAIVRASAEVHALEPIVWLVVGLTAAPSVALWTWASGRIGIGWAFALACCIEAVGVAASVLWPATPGVLLAATLLGGTFMGITALGLVGARRVTERDARRTLAIMTVAFGIGQIVGPTFAGVVRDATGSFLVPSLTAAGALLVAAMLVIMVSRQIP
ncbi:MAG: YbfB/YjiJ family MFS transporter [Gammaproteobacteria bacterium]|jgi:predicted MFS family arabinose efflux permease|nr:YbfB/YjiJ family MFS transporter [Gammaproteobacteria bacterium]